MGDFQIQTPVVFLIFNRPDTTEKVFQAIRRAKPPKLFVVADGPRQGRTDDLEKCKATRAIIDRVDWDCKVLTNYSDVNLGCKNRVSSGLDWVFEMVEEAIILEDDCLPHPDFFQFCEELLFRYREDMRIMAIRGCNFQFGRQRTKYSYYFSHYHFIWGWATWKRAWHCYDLTMKLWPEVANSSFLKDILENPRQAKYWTKVFQETYENKINSWAYRWLFCCWLQHGLTIVPNVNLISNIGYGLEATHTTYSDSPLANIPAANLSFPLSHPSQIVRDSLSDNFTYQMYCEPPFIWRIPRKIKRVFKDLYGKFLKAKKL